MKKLKISLAIIFAFALIFFGDVKLSVAATSCPYIQDSMAFGTDNNPSEVLKLQTFLKTQGYADIYESGLFDEKTVGGVLWFQEKYKDEILAPWGGEVATGFVFVTTKNKINEISCGQEIALSSSELSIINDYRAHKNLANLQIGTLSGIVLNADEEAPEVGIVSERNDDTAAIAYIQDEDDSPLEDSSLERSSFKEWITTSKWSGFILSLLGIIIAFFIYRFLTMKNEEEDKQEHPIIPPDDMPKF